MCYNVKLQMNIKINKTCYLDMFIIPSTEMHLNQNNLKRSSLV